MASTDEYHIPDEIHDSSNGTVYKKGRFLGKGGFALCYELTDNKSNAVFAGKVVSKKMMTKQNQREKLTQEIAIHRNLNHAHVLCRKRSMMELHKRRKALTEPEVRYYMRQILLGCHYLHQKKIIHRDLKLGNLLLNDDLQVKIGDFGLAARIEFDGERKRTLCGTPNYIAPEILNKKGHSFEVDIWSIGCIMYTLLFGKPPFETRSLKETYARIKNDDIHFHSTISLLARSALTTTLRHAPHSKIPKVICLLLLGHLNLGFLPAQLPASCLTVAPRADRLEKAVSRKPLLEVNANNDNATSSHVTKKGSANPGDGNPVEDNADSLTAAEARRYLQTLRNQLTALLKKNPGRDGVFGDEMSDPAAQPLVWISKWVDYSDKYGFGYQLCDEGVGVLFNDSTKLVMLANGKNVQYITKEGKEDYYTVDEYPSILDKKMKLLSYFHHYMSLHLVKAGAAIPVRECDSLSRVPYLCQWFRTSSAVVMFLTNGTLQINFVNHTKVIVCPLMAAVTYIDQDKNFRTFRFSSIEQHGCSTVLSACLQYCLDKINLLL
ncbi:hypothetical protein L9F63_004847 [Diploptera punctata]|uniref:Serine/threonine-protein kinase PLK n=1 Tax=Diploptera punctata TaxID=6984 RepID=A0AAD7ZEX7_DIPPU|nr:hypothetical protein L9F63_004847 [Diploptera punctata]